MRRVIIILGLVFAVGGATAAWHWRSSVATVTNAVQQVITPEPSFRFAVVGDNHGITPAYRQMMADINGQEFRFLLNLADTSELGTIAEFQAVKQLESTLPFPVYHTVGNHDIKADKTRQDMIDVFGHDRWYAIDQDQLHLIVLDNADRKIGFPSDELDWLEADLATHRDHTVVIAYHRPFDLPLAAILGDDETSVSGRSNERFKSIISQENVKQILTAHLHTYLPYTVADIPAVISGGGGDPAQTVLGGAKNNYFHYLDVTVKGSDVDISVVPITLTESTPE